MKIGVAGLAHFHVYDIVDEISKIKDIEIAGMADEDEAFRNIAAKRYKVPIYAGIDELLDKTGADIIITAAVNSSKAGIIAKSLEAGKHVIADKPLVTTLEGLKTVENALKKSKCRIYMILTERFNPGLVTAKKLIDDGAIGEIVNCVSYRPHRFKPETRPAWFFDRKLYGGLINDLAIHDIDIFRWLTGSDVSAILASDTSNRRFLQFKDFKDNGEVFLKMADSSTAFVRVDWLTPDAFPLHGDCRVLVVGTKGQIEVYTLEQRVLMFSDSVSPTTVQAVPRDLTLSEDIMGNISDSSRKTVIKTDDILEATRTALEAQRIADKGCA